MWREQAVMVLSFGCLMGVEGDYAQTGPEDDRPALTVRTHVEADTDPQWLPAALDLVGRTFAATGFQLVWHHCGPAAVETCHKAPAANTFIVRIQPGRMEGASHACGVSLRPDAAPGHYITLFLDCIREGAEAFGVSEPVVAAYAIAHEIGHLLLPVGHSPAGIMRARPDRFDWQRAARGALRFHPSNLEPMRTALRRRMRSANR